MSEFSPLLQHHTPLEKQLEKVSAEQLATLPVEVIRTINRPQQCPAHLLPWLAWANSVDYWRTDWSEATQRNVIDAAPEIHRKKGTKLSLDRVFASVGIIAKVIVDRESPSYTPHSFSIGIDVGSNDKVLSGEFGATEIAELQELVENTQSERDIADYRLTDEVQEDTSFIGLNTVAHANADPHDQTTIERPAMVINDLGVTDADPHDQVGINVGTTLFFFHSPAQSRRLH